MTLLAAGLSIVVFVGLGLTAWFAKRKKKAHVFTTMVGVLIASLLVVAISFSQPPSTPLGLLALGVSVMFVWVVCVINRELESKPQDSEPTDAD